MAVNQAVRWTPWKVEALLPNTHVAVLMRSGDRGYQALLLSTDSSPQLLHAHPLLHHIMFRVDHEDSEYTGKEASMASPSGDYLTASPAYLNFDNPEPGYMHFILTKWSPNIIPERSLSTDYIGQLGRLPIVCDNYLYSSGPNSNSESNVLVEALMKLDSFKIYFNHFFESQLSTTLDFTTRAIYGNQADISLYLFVLCNRLSPDYVPSQIRARSGSAKKPKKPKKQSDTVDQGATLFEDQASEDSNSANDEAAEDNELGDEGQTDDGGSKKDTSVIQQRYKIFRSKYSLSGFKNAGWAKHIMVCLEFAYSQLIAANGSSKWYRDPRRVVQAAYHHFSGALTQPSCTLPAKMYDLYYEWDRCVLQQWINNSPLWIPRSIGGNTNGIQPHVSRGSMATVYATLKSLSHNVKHIILYADCFASAWNAFHHQFNLIRLLYASPRQQPAHLIVQGDLPNALPIQDPSGRTDVEFVCAVAKLMRKTPPAPWFIGDSQLWTEWPLVIPLLVPQYAIEIKEQVQKWRAEHCLQLPVSALSTDHGSVLSFRLISKMVDAPPEFKRTLFHPPEVIAPRNGSKLTRLCTMPVKSPMLAIAQREKDNFKFYIYEADESDGDKPKDRVHSVHRSWYASSDHMRRWWHVCSYFRSPPNGHDYSFGCDWRDLMVNTNRDGSKTALSASRISIKMAQLVSECIADNAYRGGALLCLPAALHMQLSIYPSVSLSENPRDKSEWLLKWRNICNEHRTVTSIVTPSRLDAILKAEQPEVMQLRRRVLIIAHAEMLTLEQWEQLRSYLWSLPGMRVVFFFSSILGGQPVARYGSSFEGDTLSLLLSLSSTQHALENIKKQNEIGREEKYERWAMDRALAALLGLSTGPDTYDDKDDDDILTIRSAPTSSRARSLQEDEETIAPNQISHPQAVMASSMKAVLDYCCMRLWFPSENDTVSTVGLTSPMDHRDIDLATWLTKAPAAVNQFPGRLNQERPSDFYTLVEFRHPVFIRVESMESEYAERMLTEAHRPRQLTTAIALSGDLHPLRLATYLAQVPNKSCIVTMEATKQSATGNTRMPLDWDQYKKLWTKQDWMFQGKGGSLPLRLSKDVLFKDFDDLEPAKHVENADARLPNYEDNMDVEEIQVPKRGSLVPIGNVNN